MRTCGSCAVRLPISEGRGRPRRYCSAACRQRAYRRRRRIPECMTRLVRWVRHDTHKRPLRADGRGHASVADRRSWASYTEARRSSAGVGLGFMLGGGIGAIDLDHCIDNRGRIAPWAREIIDRHRGEALLIEKSMSGRGVHIFLPMPEQPGRRIRDGDVAIEIYSRARYIATTGKALALAA